MLLIVIETMAIAFCDDPDIKGVNFGSQEQKCALFADDVLLYVTSPSYFPPQSSANAAGLWWHFWAPN